MVQDISQKWLYRMEQKKYVVKLKLHSVEKEYTLAFVLRVVMGKDLYLYGLMVMVENWTTVLQMDIHQVSTLFLLVLLGWMEYLAHLTNHALQKWL